MRRDIKQQGKYQMKAPPSFENYFQKMSQQNKRVPQKNSSNSERSTVLFRSNNSISQSSQNNAKTSKFSNSTTTKRTLTQSAAPKVQYSMYLNDTRNVFYEDREQIKSLQTYYTLRPLLLKMFMFLFLGWFILYFIRPYPHLCPHNADCGVYIHCHTGYELKNQQCVISLQTKLKTNSLCISAIENLKYEHGTKDCSDGIDKSEKFSKKSVSKILQEWAITTEAYEKQIYLWFQSQENQQKYKFSYRNDEIWTSEKLYTIFCRFQKIVQTPFFYLYSTLAILLLFSLLIWHKLYQQKQKAYKIYEHLKAAVKKKDGDMKIELAALQKIFGKISNQLWQNIDKARVEDKCIAYYEDRDLHWKII